MLQYKGDLQPGYFPNNPSPALELIGRYNVSMAAVVRANLLFAPNVVTSSLNSSDPYIKNIQPAYGNTTYLAEAGIFGEYNFFNYRNPKNRYVFGSPYLFGGPVIGVSQRVQLNNFSSDTFLIAPNRDTVIKAKLAAHTPFFGFVLGVGYKQQLGQYFNIGVQFSGRFLFSDNFDSASDRELTYQNVKDQNGNLILNPDTRRYLYKPDQGQQIANKADRDAYFFLGISLTYTIKEVICPFKYEKKSEKQ